MLDDLLEWCSERETGSIRAFRQAHDWLAQRAGATKAQAAYALLDLEALGHLEVDYQADRWAIAPPVVGVIEDSGGLAVLAGARPRKLMRRLFSLEDDSDPQVQAVSQSVYPDRFPSDKDGAPATIVVNYGSDEALTIVCDALGIKLERDLSARLAHVLPSLDGYLGVNSVKAAPPGFEPRRMTLGEWVRFDPVESDREPGAYEYLRYGPPRYIFNDGQNLFQVDKRVAVYAELQRTSTHVLTYDRRRRQLLVPGTCALPLLHARCLVLRTGQLPTFTRTPPAKAGKRPVNVYENVPEPLFARIADRLGQRLIYL